MSELRRSTSPLRGVGGCFVPSGVLELLAQFYFGPDVVLTILFLRLAFLSCFFVFSSLSVQGVAVSADHAVGPGDSRFWLPWQPDNNAIHLQVSAAVYRDPKGRDSCHCCGEPAHQHRWSSKGEYDEVVSAIVHMKCSSASLRFGTQCCMEMAPISRTSSHMASQSCDAENRPEE